jgi:HEAT repeat protein
MLLDYLPDMRGVIGLGELESKRAEPAIAKLLEAERSSGAQYAIPFLAKALWQIRPDARWLRGVLQVLASASRDDERRNAAEALKAFRDPAAVSALIKALDDPAGLVRHHAACSLLAIHGLPHYSLDWNGQHMVYRVMSENPEIFEGGKKAILASISEKPILAK